MEGCIFCSIIAKKVDAGIVYEDADFIVIKDIKPIAKHHCLVIPKTHYATLAEMPAAEAAVLGRIMKKIPDIAASLNITGGYRLIINQGADAGQTVGHLHIHLLGGQKMGFTVD